VEEEAEEMKVRTEEEVKARIGGALAMVKVERVQVMAKVEGVQAMAKVEGAQAMVQVGEAMVKVEGESRKVGEGDLQK
jgi:hypothetical protein